MAAATDYLRVPTLAPTLGALPAPPRTAISRLAESGFRAVQLSAAQPGLRPRELDRSARRDLEASLRRREIEIAGLDLWIPPDHFDDVEKSDRAVGAVFEAVQLAADLGRCPLSAMLPTDASMREGVVAAAARLGVLIADHARDRGLANPPVGIGIDCVAELAAGEDPAVSIAAAGTDLLSVRVSDLFTSGLRGPIGLSEGRLDVLAVQVSLSVCGFDRPAVLDARQWTEPWEGIERSLETWHEAAVQP